MGVGSSPADNMANVINCTGTEITTAPLTPSTQWWNHFSQEYDIVNEYYYMRYSRRCHEEIGVLSFDASKTKKIHLWKKVFLPSTIYHQSYGKARNYGIHHQFSCFLAKTSTIYHLTPKPQLPVARRRPGLLGGHWWWVNPNGLGIQLLYFGRRPCIELSFGANRPAAFLVDVERWELMNPPSITLESLPGHPTTIFQRVVKQLSVGEIQAITNLNEIILNHHSQHNKKHTRSYHQPVTWCWELIHSQRFTSWSSISTAPLRRTWAVMSISSSCVRLVFWPYLSHQGRGSITSRVTRVTKCYEASSLWARILQYLHTMTKNVNNCCGFNSWIFLWDSYGQHVMGYRSQPNSVRVITMNQQSDSVHCPSMSWMRQSEKPLHWLGMKLLI